MGCDIHVYMEKKNKEYGEWETINLYRIDQYSNDIELVNAYSGRDYVLFSILAGVRGWENPFISPRGIPEDASTKLEQIWAGDKEDYCHTPSWYDLYELDLFIKGYIADHPENEEGINDRLKGFITSLVNYCEFAGEYIWTYRPNEYRVVFWFDS